MIWCIPDKATKSVMSRPTLQNFVVILFMPSKGEGIEVLAPPWFAFLLSLLPNNTFHEGPPACIPVKKSEIKNKFNNVGRGFVFVFENSLNMYYRWFIQYPVIKSPFAKIHKTYKLEILALFPFLEWIVEGASVSQAQTTWLSYDDSMSERSISVHLFLKNYVSFFYFLESSKMICLNGC